LLGGRRCCRDLIRAFNQPLANAPRPFCREKREAVGICILVLQRQKNYEIVKIVIQSDFFP
jgi:hypothetical protein